MELCLFLPRKIVGVAGGTKKHKRKLLFVFLWHKEKKTVFVFVLMNNYLTMPKYISKDIIAIRGVNNQKYNAIYKSTYLEDL